MRHANSETLRVKALVCSRVIDFCHDMPGQKRSRGGKHSGAERAPKKVKKVCCRSTLLLSELVANARMHARPRHCISDGASFSSCVVVNVGQTRAGASASG